MTLSSKNQKQYRVIFLESQEHRSLILLANLKAQGFQD